MKQVLVLGSTGSIGKNTLEVIKLYPEKYQAAALVANQDVKTLAQQAIEFNVKAVAVSDESKFQELKSLLSGTSIEVLAGENAVCELAARGYDITMSAIVGVAGLKPTMAAIANSKVLAIANKESLVCAGTIIMAEVQKHGTKLIPVDSEHSAIFQIFATDQLDNIKHVTITASGGPFKHFTLEQMASVTPEQAIAHPTWKMGPKISTDCATLLNKGLEVIEACALFPIKPSQVEVVTHYESIIHGMVHYADGSTLAHLSLPDMKSPIAYAMAHPDRIAIPHRELKLDEIGKMHFAKPDYVRFPLLKLSFDALNDGLAAQIILNSSNEVAVNAFLQNRIGFLDISKKVANALDTITKVSLNSLSDVLQFNEEVILKTKAAL
jgi:1-deoxy-D-xylulose-5-phosphate reductoisomerase